MGSVSKALRRAVDALVQVATRTLLDPRWRDYRLVRWTYVHLYLIGKRLVEHGELTVLRELTTRGMVVVDIGANVGFYALRIGKWVGPTGRVLAFEPDPFSFRALHERARKSGYANVEAYHMALGDVIGKAVLYCSTANRADNRLHPSDGDSHAEQHVIDIWSLDAFLARSGTRRIDAVKIDVQGAEERVLRGANATLRDNDISWIWVEFSPSHLRDAGTDPQRFLELLNGLEMDVFEVGRGYLRPMTQPEEYERRIGSGYGDLVLRPRVPKAS